MVKGHLIGCGLHGDTLVPFPFKRVNPTKYFCSCLYVCIYIYIYALEELAFC